jgi:hypothetical protein
MVNAELKRKSVLLVGAKQTRLAVNLLPGTPPALAKDI